MIGFELLDKYFPSLTKKQIAQYRQLYPLYEDWNSKINMISRKDFDQFYERHVLHSLSVLKIINFKPGQTVLDVGTGGGFPAIPLAISNPDVKFTLVDSIGKKLKVVSEIVNTLDLKNVTIIHDRMETVQGKFDFIMNRAVAPLSSIIGWTIGKYNKGAYLISIKGGNLDVEIKQAGKKVNVQDISSFYEEEFFETKKVLLIKMG